jgi:hypothetical protein
MSDLNEKPGEAMAAGVAKATASQTSFAGRIRNYFLTSLVFLPLGGPRVIPFRQWPRCGFASDSEGVSM